MKIDFYHLYRHFDSSSLLPPIMLDVLSMWSRKKGWDSRIRIAREKDIAFHTDADVVAFSVYTMTAPMSYRASEKLRANGKIVVMGGPHFRNQNYREALGKCNAVASSISEEQWLALLTDIEAGNIEPGGSRTRSIIDSNHDFRYPDGLYESSSFHRWHHVPCVPTTVGCPYGCDYCGPLMSGRYVERDPAAIQRDMAHVKSRVIVIPDASFGLNKNHVLEIMNAIAPLKKKFYVTTTLARIADRELLRALAHGGVRAIAVGIETLRGKLQKHGNILSREDLTELIRDCHDLGIFIQGNFILGLDADGPEVFDDVFDFYEKSELDIVSADVLVPYPHTPLYHTLLKQGRIVDGDWSHYDYKHVVYRPQKMSTEELRQGLASYYKRVVESRCLMKRLGQIYSRYGLCAETGVLAAYLLFRHWEAMTKSEQFARPPVPTCPPLCRDDSNDNGEEGITRSLGLLDPFGRIKVCRGADDLPLAEDVEGHDVVARLQKLGGHG